MMMMIIIEMALARTKMLSMRMIKNQPISPKPITQVRQRDIWNNDNDDDDLNEPISPKLSMKVSQRDIGKN